jgi:hypothetical protein
MIRKTYVMICDANISDTCITHSGDTFEDNQFDTAIELIKGCVGIGWKQIKGKDYCPECAKKMKRVK